MNLDKAGPTFTALVTGAPGRVVSRRSTMFASVVVRFEEGAPEPWVAVAARAGFAASLVRFAERGALDVFADSYLAPAGSLAAALIAADKSGAEVRP